MKTFNELCGLGWNKNKMIAFCRGGSRDSSSGSDSSSSSSNSSSSSDSGGGFLGTSYSSFSDMFDGGGPGMSGSSFSTKDNRDLDTDGDGNITDSEALAGTGSINLAGGLDGSKTSEADLINSDLSDDEFWEEFESGTNTTTVDRVNPMVSNSSSGNQITTTFESAPDNFYNEDSGFDNNVTSALTGVATNVSQPGGGDPDDDEIVTGGGDDVVDDGTDDDENTTVDPGDDEIVTGGGDEVVTGGGDNSLINDLNSQITALQDQLTALQNAGSNSGAGNTIVYEGSNTTNTSLPDDYLTEADLARYLDNLDLGSNAYDPAAFLNAYGFALDPSMMGNLIPTMQSNNGLFVRRAVKDKDTGEIRYVNVPIGPGATGGNAGLSQFQMERRAGFGNLL